MCEHRSLSTPRLPGACAASHCQGPVIRGQLLWENAWRASGCCNVTPASATAGSPRLLLTAPSPRPEGDRAPKAAAPLTPSCLGGEQTPSGDLNIEAGPNPKLNPRSCMNKEEKGKFLPAASEARSSGLKLHKQLDVLASVEYLNRQRITPNSGGGLREQEILIFPLFLFFVSVYVHASG